MSFLKSIENSALRCPVNSKHAGFMQASYQSAVPGLSDEAVLCAVHEWMAKKLPCVAGRREYNRGKYMLRVAKRETVESIYSEFRQGLELGEVSACLFIFNNAAHADVAQAFAHLAEQMEPISKVPASDLANGAALTKSIELNCPVTNIRTIFDDFECIAFCPQSLECNDKLYDPLMAMPYPCVNLSSDVYGFSQFVRTSALATWNLEVYEQRNLGKIEKLLRICVERWQRVASATIANYQAITNTDLCPVHLTPDENYWVAGHKDPAFAEQMKMAHMHELPRIYANRIADGWMEYFRSGRIYQAKGLAREGCPTGAV
jgi:hypothetical protein